jgi:hypothetical protein
MAEVTIEQHPHDKALRRVQFKLSRYELRRAGLLAPSRTNGGTTYPVDDVVPRSHLIGLAAYFFIDAIQQWRTHHPKRKTVPWDELIRWLEGLDMIIPVELDPVIQGKERV